MTARLPRHVSSLSGRSGHGHDTRPASVAAGAASFMILASIPQPFSSFAFLDPPPHTTIFPFEQVSWSDVDVANLLASFVNCSHIPTPVDSCLITRDRPWDIWCLASAVNLCDRSFGPRWIHTTPMRHLGAVMGIRFREEPKVSCADTVLRLHCFVSVI